MSRAQLLAYGLGWVGGIQALVIGLIARRWRPFDTPEALTRLRSLVGLATVIGAALSMGFLLLWVPPAMPLGLKVWSGVISLLTAPIICIWFAGFPPRRLLPAQLRFSIRRTLATPSAIGESEGPGVVHVRRRPWPQRLWSVGVSLSTVVSSRQAIDLIAGQLLQDFRYTQPLLPEGESAGALTPAVGLESVPWPPNRTFSPWPRFDATVSGTAFGSVISADIRLPWYPLAISVVMVVIGLGLAVLSGSLGPLFFSLIGIGLYLAGRFIVLPDAARGLVRLLSPLATFAPPPAK